MYVISRNSRKVNQQKVFTQIQVSFLLIFFPLISSREIMHGNDYKNEMCIARHGHKNLHKTSGFKWFVFYSYCCFVLRRHTSFDFQAACPFIAETASPGIRSAFVVSDIDLRILWPSRTIVKYDILSGQMMYDTRACC